MRTTSFNGESPDRSRERPNQLECLGTAAVLLHKMFAALQSLAPNNAALERALVSSETEVLERLSRLRHAVDLLSQLDDRQTIRILRGQATAHITWLTSAIDDLTLSAVNDDGVWDVLHIANGQRLN